MHDDPRSTLRALTLPLHMTSLLLVAIFSFLFLLAANAEIIALPLALVIGSWFFKYAFLLLDHAAQGRPGALVLTLEDANPVGETRPLLYGLAIAAFCLATGALDGVTDPNVVFALRLLGLLALPAVLATHLVTGAFARALNPLTVTRMVGCLGPGYLLVLLVAAGCAWIGRDIVLGGGHLGLFLQIALLELLWLAMFAVLGGLIHERRVELGFEPEQSPERQRQRADEARDRERNRFVDQLFVEFRSGSTANAWETIQRRVGASHDPVAEYAWIHARVAAWPNPRLANRVARELLPLLLARQRNGEALAIVKNRLDADSGFRPQSGDELIRLAELARAGGERSVAGALVTDFEQRFPDHPARNTARRLAAELGHP